MTLRLQLPLFDDRDRDPDQFAEVVETSTTEFLAQCLDPQDLAFPAMPAFGSWVRSRDEETGNQVYAVVYHALTAPIDSVHRAQALGLSIAQLRDEQPQIFAMLKTEFRSAIVGFETFTDGNRREATYQYLPPRPPQIHQAVYYCTPDEVRRFSNGLDFLRTLLQINGAPVESLVAAAIREVYQIRKADRDWLVQAGRMLGLLLKDDYDRLRVILSQVHP